MDGYPYYLPVYYTGIGSRSTPPGILVLMEQIGADLAEWGFTLRSGGAAGADSAFESGCDAVEGSKEIFLPWTGFSSNPSHFASPTAGAFEIAKQFHPTWYQLSQNAKRLMARNVHQVLGLDLNTPVSFVVCWTPDGCESDATRTRKTGGTGQAISIAASMSIPVFNLKNSFAIENMFQCAADAKEKHRSNP